MIGGHVMAKVTIKEIAQISGVSTATVSRVLNNAGGYSDETKRRVLEVLEKYHYQTNVMAKGLRTRQTKSIGVVLPDLTNEYFAKIAVAIEHVLMEKGYSINIYNLSEDANKERLMIRDLESRGVDGLIYVSGYKDLPKKVKYQSIPVVCINRLEEMDKEVPVIESDHQYGGYLAVRTLLEKGSKKIVMLRDERDILPINFRYQGYLEALKEYGYQSDSRLICRIPFNVGHAQEAITTLIENGIDFDGIFASSDLLAIGALKALQIHEIKVPVDVQVVGFDNVTFSQYSHPTLTTIHQATDQLGERASELLLDLMNNQNLDSNKRMVVPVDLVERETTR